MRTDLRDEEARANERMAQLTGICPKCGDEGWWIDDDTSGDGTLPEYLRKAGFHYCSCAAGIKAQEEDGEGG